MSHAHDHDPTVPREALIAIAAVLLAVMGLAGAVRLGIVPQSANPELSRAAANVAPAQQRNLRFADREDGAVLITDADTGETVKVIGFGEGGFARATMRRMAKRRMHEGIGPLPPFTLTRWQNGALSLSDPQTGETAEIHGFGADHSATFAEMLEGTRS